MTTEFSNSSSIERNFLATLFAGPRVNEPIDPWGDLPRFREVVEGMFAGGRPVIAAVAKALGVSGRTLQRRLLESQTTFDREIDHCRAVVACRELESGKPMQDISVLLGFRDPSAFSRAFRRWKGTSPTRYLAALRASRD